MIEVVLKCGEKYIYNLIREVIDHGDFVEFDGNFKPRGRYIKVKLWKKSIENWEQIKKIINVTQAPYWCSVCCREHSRGDIYKKHYQYKMNEKVEEIPSDNILPNDWRNLRGIAQRQLANLIKKMKTVPQKRELYIQEINKLLLYEGVVKNETKKDIN